jgi:hypothetical protein
MRDKSVLLGLLSAGLLLAFQTAAQGKNVTVELASRDVASYTTAQEEFGTFHVVEFTIPEDLAGKRLDTVMLELYVDVSLMEGVAEETTPVVEILPLTEKFAGDGVPKFTPTSTAVRNVVPGERRKLLLDITEMAKGWIAEPETNHGVIIGTLTGPKDGTITLRDDVLGGGKVAKVTFFYQSRLGGRVSH